MATKLTLSLPESTIRQAKRIAKKRGTSVSALFARSIDQLEREEAATESVAERYPDLASLVGSIEVQEAFDARSARILKRHG